MNLQKYIHWRLLGGLLTAVTACSLGVAQGDQSTGKMFAEHQLHLTDFQVIEFRRYVIKKGERAHFAHFFEDIFPGAFEQEGTIVAGSFLERRNENVFTWIRGIHTLDDRAIANAAFYYGPVWNEYRHKANSFIENADNDMLLRPLSPERGIPIQPEIDLFSDTRGAQGVLVAQIFSVKANSVEAFAKAAEPTFASYRATGAREAGVLVTLDGNNFPLLTVRTDGPFLVWLGLVKDSEMLEKQFTPVAERSVQSLSATGLIRGAPELVILDPTPRSRLRWLPEWKEVGPD